MPAFTMGRRGSEPGRAARSGAGAGIRTSMALTQTEIFEKVRGVVVEALAVDEEEVTPQASLFKDLGAESIDVLDIGFKLEQEFGIKVPQDELNPAAGMQDARYIKDGKFTPEGLEQLRAKLSDFDLSEFERDPRVSRLMDLFTVGFLVKYVEGKLAAK